MHTAREAAPPAGHTALLPPCGLTHLLSVRLHTPEPRVAWLGRPDTELWAQECGRPSGQVSGALGEVRVFFLPPQFQTELRKILVSLIEVAQKLLALNPDAVELFKKANGMGAPRGTGSCVQTPLRAPTSEAVSAPTVPVPAPPDPRVSIGNASSVCASRGCGAPAPPAGRGLRVHVLGFGGAWPAGGPLGLRAGGQPSHWPGPHRWPRLSPAAMLDEEEDGRVDEAALRQLTEMGFPETRAAKALRLNQYVRAASFPCCRCCGAPLGRLPPSPSLRLNHVQ